MILIVDTMALVITKGQICRIILIIDNLVDIFYIVGFNLQILLAEDDIIFFGDVAISELVKEDFVVICSIEGILFYSFFHVPDNKTLLVKRLLDFNNDCVWV